MSQGITFLELLDLEENEFDNEEEDEEEDEDQQDVKQSPTRSKLYLLLAKVTTLNFNYLI